MAESMGDQLSPDERTKLMDHFVGYDISPDMVRLSLVNMYLHSFPNPNIYEYDTLTSEERWDETYDVIMANPPFMSPKGGIRPHKRFSVQANRSEVLFVDYIAEHLNTHGRAGVIVPEGIIFQSGNAYKALRKELVEKYLFAVVSLPAGVFQPYSGVKTSILLMDKQLAKRAKDILFVKVTNDGFDLGAQRRAIEKNDLTQALAILQEYKQALQSGENPSAILSRNEVSHMVVIAEKTKIAKNGDYNLSGERYRESLVRLHQQWPMVELGEVCETTSGGTPLKSRSEYYENGTIPWLKSGEISQGVIYNSEEKISDSGLKNSSAKILPINTVLVAMYGATAGQVGLLKFESATNQAICGVLPNDKYIPEFLYWVLKSQRDYMVALSGGGAQPNISQNIIRKIIVPLPPLEIQKEIVVEIDGYQKIIDGAKLITENWKSIIKIDPEWEILTIGELVKNKIIEKPLDGNHGEIHPKASDYVKDGVPFIMANDLVNGEVDIEHSKKITVDQAMSLRTGFAKNEDVLLTHKGTIGRTAILHTNHDYVVLTPQVTYYRVKNDNILSNRFLKYYFESDKFQVRLKQLSSIGATRAYLGITDQLELEVALPPLEIQNKIIVEIEEEQKRVHATKELMKIFEQKIKDKIAEVWGEPSNKPLATSLPEDIPYAA